MIKSTATSVIEFAEMLNNDLSNTNFRKQKTTFFASRKREKRRKTERRKAREREKRKKKKRDKKVKKGGFITTAINLFLSFVKKIKGCIKVFK